MLDVFAMIATFSHGLVTLYRDATRRLLPVRNEVLGISDIVTLLCANHAGACI